MATPCTQYQEELSALLDSELGNDEMGRVTDHLTECLDCAQRFETLKRLSGLINEASSQATPEDQDLDLWSHLSESVDDVCSVIVDDLSAYLDGELPPASQQGVKDHLEQCQRCLDSFKMLNRTNQLLARGLALPDDLDTNVWEAVARRMKADCDVIESELSPYLDQEVATLRHRAITSHLVDCLPCRARFDEMTGVGDVIREHYQPDIPENLDLWPGIKSKMQVVPFKQREKKGKSAKKAGPRLAVISAAAAAVIGLLGTVAVWLSMPDDSNFTPISAEAYLIESSFQEPVNLAEAVIYEQ